jgi:hypothetical protein
MLTKDEAVAINLGEQGFRHQSYSHWNLLLSGSAALNRV